ncbi:serine/threonine-protein kinase [Streptomyces sp. NPDC059002]|uniref:serine/threonine-protein kinase n=1 Tax=Streptomyces sp. NPDC059002 TaxID=3346690 RepID=UPI003689D18F
MHPLEADEPTVIGPYRLLGRLGSGGMGRVYLGRSEGGRTVAVKVVHPHFALDEEFRARFRREVDAARRVGGDWTAPVLDADPDASVPWVATGYAAGPSLTEAVRDAAPLPEHSVRVLGAGLAEALAHVHGLGLVHRDVKPSNVLLTLDGPRLIDFGIARATDGTASLTSTGVSIGSPGYMSPEQILGKGVTGAADVFSLGAVLVYAATGASPFTGDSSAALLYKVVHEQPELGALGGEMREVAAACLAKDPGERPTPQEIARRLAPEGAAPLVAAGWLPGPVVERVSRSAVRILDMDTGAGAGAAAAGAEALRSGPVAFNSPSVNGVFGPADPSYAEVPQREVPHQRDARPPQPAGIEQRPADAKPAKPPGKLSVSVAATSAPEGPNGRGRKVSCTVALAVAGALAAVTVGSVFVFGMLPDDDNSSKDQGARPPAATGGPSSGADDADGAVPKVYLGKWSGEADANGGQVPLGTFEVTLRQAKAGERVGTVVQHDPIGNTCTDVLTLKSASKKELVATGKGAQGNGGQCAQTAHTVYLRPAGKALQYTSDDPDAGDPRARLARLE